MCSCCTQDDAAAANWFPVTELPALAFDHKQIIREALQTLSGKPEVQETGKSVCSSMLLGETS